MAEAQRTLESLCIACPRGCRLRAAVASDGTCRIEGARCKLGREYGRQEALSPRRVLTTTLATAWGRPVPARSSRPIERGLLLDVQRRLADVVLDTPVHAGDTLASNIDGQGADLVATADGPVPPSPAHEDVGRSMDC